LKREHYRNRPPTQRNPYFTYWRFADDEQNCPRRRHFSEPLMRACLKPAEHVFVTAGDWIAAGAAGATTGTAAAMPSAAALAASQRRNFMDPP
jgi:hypothetical protein